MAIPCQGVTFTWGGQTLSEVQELEVDLQRGLPIGRSVIWTASPGEVRLLGFSITNLPGSEYGTRKRLTIQCMSATAGGSLVTLFDADCVYRDTNTRANANDAVRFAHTFSVMDTLNAPSNP